ncbi:hypothetical protein [Caballeronia sordidicola]|uniref:hypothetical protein n=1 Tax=Caballeronia sordidicola TaxID=196367 RepID=UPI0009DEC05B|nr:hypothetical protein [Caballeronia sordidicola]
MPGSLLRVADERRAHPGFHQGAGGGEQIELGSRGFISFGVGSDEMTSQPASRVTSAREIFRAPRPAGFAVSNPIV